MRKGFMRIVDIDLTGPTISVRIGKTRNFAFDGYRFNGPIIFPIWILDRHQHNLAVEQYPGTLTTKLICVVL